MFLVSFLFPPLFSQGCLASRLDAPLSAHLSSLLPHPQTHRWAVPPGVGIVMVAAFIACNFESFLGATIQGKVGWMTNEVVNAIQGSS